MPLLAEQIPEDHRKVAMVIRTELDGVGARAQEVLVLTGDGYAREVTLDVGAEDRHAGVRKPFGQYLKRHRLAGSRRTGHDAVPIGVFEQQLFSFLVGIVRLPAGADEN